VNSLLALIGLGFALGLDNFRTAIALGGLKPTLLQSVKTSLIFGLWDGIAPAVGILIGGYVGTKISDTGEILATAGLAAYGVWVIVKAIRSPEPADPGMKTARRWLPVPLSIDNLAAGAALGLAGYSVWLAPPLFAFCTFVVSVAGHQIGRTVANFIPRVRTDLLTGIAFMLMAGMVVAGVGDF
jgi:manganese efflux pump family protein